MTHNRDMQTKARTSSHILQHDVYKGIRVLFSERSWKIYPEAAGEK